MSQDLASTESQDAFRALPSAPEAELALLSCMALAPAQVFAICRAAGIHEGSFLPANHKGAFSLMAGFAADGTPVDFVTVSSAFRAAGNLDAFGGMPFVASLFTTSPSPTLASHYAAIVAEKSLAREIIRIGTLYAGKAYGSEDEPHTLIAGLFKDVCNLVGNKRPAMTVAQAVDAIRDEIVTGAPDGELLPMGWPVLDTVLALYRGDYLVISAPTSCGKSALALQICLKYAMTGKRAAFYGLEMSTKRNVKRAIANLANYTPDFVRDTVRQSANETFKVTVVENFVSVAKTLKTLPFYVRDDLHDFTAIVADIRIQHAQNPLTFVAVDYLQLIRSEGSKERRQLQIAAMTQAFKLLAAELAIIICTPSQVNKDGGTREAADAENDASALLKIVAEVDDDGNPRFGKLIVWKSREGARFLDVPVTFNGRHARFEETK